MQDGRAVLGTTICNNQPIASARNDAAAIGIFCVMVAISPTRLRLEKEGGGLASLSRLQIAIVENTSERYCCDWIEPNENAGESY